MATTSHPHLAVQQHPRVRADTARRIGEVGWGVFLLMTGAFWAFGDMLPSGAWLASTGILLLALNAARYATQVGVEGFTLVIGILALVAGITDLANVKPPLVAMSLMIIGLVVLGRPLFARRT